MAGLGIYAAAWTSLEKWATSLAFVADSEIYAAVLTGPVRQFPVVAEA